MSLVPELATFIDLKVAIALLALMLWPLLALSVKRYHDFGSKGWLSLFQFFLLFGWLQGRVYLCL